MTMSVQKFIFFVVLFFFVSSKPLFAGDDAGAGTIPIGEDPIGEDGGSTVRVEFPVEIKLIIPLTIKRDRNMLFPVKMAGFEGTVSSNEEGLSGRGADASFTVTGEPYATYVIGGLETLTITDQTGTSSLDVSLLIFDASGRLIGGAEGSEFGVVSKTLSQEGSDTFFIRGTVRLLSRHKAGLYSGTREIIASYY